MHPLETQRGLTQWPWWGDTREVAVAVARGRSVPVQREMRWPPGKLGGPPGARAQRDASAALSESGAASTAFRIPFRQRRRTPGRRGQRVLHRRLDRSTSACRRRGITERPAPWVSITPSPA